MSLPIRPSWQPSLEQPCKVHPNGNRRAPQTLGSGMMQMQPVTLAAGTVSIGNHDPNQLSSQKARISRPRHLDPPVLVDFDQRQRTTDPNAVVDYWTAIKHRYNKTPNTNGANILCPVSGCGQRFGRIDSLERHVDTVAARCKANKSAGVGPHELEALHQNLQESNDFVLCRQYHFEEHRDALKCPHCGVEQSRKDALQRHLRSLCKALGASGSGTL